MSETPKLFYKMHQNQIIGPLLRQGSPLLELNNEKIVFSDKDLNHIFDFLTGKGSRLSNSFSNNRLAIEPFRKKHLSNNTYMKIGLHKILYDLANERKIGRNLKGLSKLLLEQIENKLWDIIQLEIKLYHKEYEISRCHEILTQDPNDIFKITF